MKLHVFFLLLPFSLFYSGMASAASWTGNFNAFLGGKALDDNDWFADEQAEVGARLDFRQTHWPLSIAADVNFSEGDFNGNVFFPGLGVSAYREDVETCEFNLGVRKYWDSVSNMHPFVGGGLAYARVDATGDIIGGQHFSDRGDGIGIWLNGGILWTLNALNIGVDLRYTQVEVNMHAGDFEGGGGHAGILLGYHW